ncbi:MAG: aminotransferase class I/II-fold pyridoxal phosphate-dependent enzyme [Betaproteobacteria bacterium]|nr:aminotransferase class I/II-fold pyridoxal phosphate-dependent enzyme [Betaproteobacteria bacterium]
MIDLRSDTVTRPTEAMLESMREATFGDDSRDGDETVSKLEALAAERTGKEAGAFMPSGTMTNLVAMLTHANRGGEVLLEDGSHTLNAELGGIAGVAGLFYRGLPGKRGAMDLDALRETLRPVTRHHMGTALVWMENTHNRAGGAVLPLAYMQSVYGLAREHNVPVHLDGARLFNAAAALGVKSTNIAQHCDSVCFCVSKGLSAPVGSILCGSGPFIERARAHRRMVGGNMRQAGPLAAAGILALETMVDRLPEDHQTAKRLAEGLHRVDPSVCDPKDVETNLVRADVRKSGRRAAQWSADLKAKGVLVAPADSHTLRFVTHRHIGAPDVDTAVGAFAELWKKELPPMNADTRR